MSGIFRFCSICTPPLPKVQMLRVSLQVSQISLYILIHNAIFQNGILPAI